jgi:hypothetical protein
MVPLNDKTFLSRNIFPAFAKTPMERCFSVMPHRMATRKQLLRHLEQYRDSCSWKTVMELNKNPKPLKPEEGEAENTSSEEDE